MRVAFLANHFLDPANPRSWSGLPFFMKRSLEEAGVETFVISPRDTHRAGSWARFFYWRILRRKRYLRNCCPPLLKSYAEQIQQQFARIEVDAVFSSSTWLTAYLQTKLPVVVWTDACFAGVVNYYPSFTNLAPVSLRDGNAAEQQALDGCTQIIYSVQWAIDSALKNYRVPASKVSLVPFGANLVEPPSFEDVLAKINVRDRSRCELLFVGVDWKRKGADIAVKAADILVKSGVRTRLTIVGCQPPNGFSLPPYVEIIPFISKQTPEGRAKLNNLYARSHFFVFPTRAEAFGIVLAEASTFGVPCLTTATGGLSSVVANGINGKLFHPSANGSEYAAFILGSWNHPNRYRRLAERTAEEGATRFSWKTCGRQVADILSASMHHRTANVIA